MNVSTFESNACRRIRKYLDSYLSNELLIETNHEVLEHLEKCQDCSTQVEARSRVRSVLQRAVRSEEAPEGLESRIRKQLRDATQARRPRWGASAWALAAAAAVVVSLAGFVTLQVWHPEENPLLARRTAEILSIGAADHQECAIDHGMQNRRFTFEQMSERLGSDYIQLVPAVTETVSPSYEVVVAHRCRAAGREFVHIIMSDGARVVSLSITPKNGDSFSREGLPSQLQAGGVPVFHGRARSFEVAAFESSDHLAFMVSDLPADQHALLATRMAPPVRSLLSRLEIG